MKDIRIDSQGRQRCWNCGGTGFTEKRTTRSKVMVGVGTFLTKKKLKCQSCGEYNDTGDSKPYTGPASAKAAKKSGAAQIDERDAMPPPPAAGGVSVADELERLAALHQQGLLTPTEFAAQKDKLLG